MEKPYIVEFLSNIDEPKSKYGIPQFVSGLEMSKRLEALILEKTRKVMRSFLLNCIMNIIQLWVMNQVGIQYFLRKINRLIKCPLAEEKENRVNF